MAWESVFDAEEAYPVIWDILEDPNSIWDNGQSDWDSQDFWEESFNPQDT